MYCYGSDFMIVLNASSLYDVVFYSLSNASDGKRSCTIMGIPCCVLGTIMSGPSG